MTTWLTLYYTLAAFVLITAASGVLYWELGRSIDQENRDYLRQKMQVLASILQREPFDRSGVEQEVLEEAEVSRESRSPFLLRVLDSQNQLIVETPGMRSNLPQSVFPQSETNEPSVRPWRSDKLNFLLGSIWVNAHASPSWHVQAALGVSSEEALLSRYRRDIASVLVGGLLLAAAVGAWITRRGLQPIAAITRATERVGVHQLRERIQAGSWPKELASLAIAFDHMLDRLQEAFERLSQFSADLAHELRTPINNLMGEAQVALSRDRSAAEYSRVLQSALEEHGRLASMIDSMLFLAQADQARFALSPVSLDARAELQAVADFYQALADEQGVQLMCDGQGQVFADPLLLRRALSNLLSNALRYTPRGKAITLKVVAGRDGATIVRVADSGTGVAAEHLPKLSDRFYRVDPSRTDSSGAGTGLGLAIVKSIMTLHGGSLLIESTVGVGTVASLVFSLSAA